MKISSGKILTVFVLATLSGFFLATIIGLFLKADFTFSQISLNKNHSGIPNQDEKLKDPDRTNILILGLRGKNDPNGGLLTDAILIVSIKKNQSITLISIPRDLFVRMPSVKNNQNKPAEWEKINYAYVLGEKIKPHQGGLLYAKAAVSKITGLYLDYGVVVDFRIFRKVIQTLGGVDIYLSKPFTESHQWGYTFYLPAGQNHLDAGKALYFARSRYSTSDFDRMKRQQQLILAIKKKATSLGILANPAKLWKLMDILGKYVVTDIQSGDFTKLYSLYQSIKNKPVKKIVFDDSPNGALISVFLRKVKNHLYGDVVKVERIRIKPETKSNSGNIKNSSSVSEALLLSVHNNSTSSKNLENSSTTSRFKEKRTILKSILVSSNGWSEQRNGAYILLPKRGNFDIIKHAIAGRKF